MIGFLIQSPLEYYAEKTPGHPAMSCEGVEISYKELNQRSNQLAHALIENGARRQDRVGIFMHKSLELGAAIYGVLKAGCIFVPLDPLMPADRLSFILRDCGIRHIISSNALSDILIPIIEEQPLHAYGIDKNINMQAPPAGLRLPSGLIVPLIFPSSIRNLDISCIRLAPLEHPKV